MSEKHPSLLSVPQILRQFAVEQQRGMTDRQIEETRNAYGWNELPKKKRSMLLLFLAQFNNVLVYILLGALGISIAIPFLEGNNAIEGFIDSIVILAILLLNAVLGFIQEYKAEEAIALLEKLTSPTAHVRRSGREFMVPSRELVPGDIVILDAGDRISADGHLIQESHLAVNESSLTGESTTVDKMIEPLEKEVPLAEQRNMLFSGTLVTGGSGEYIITATGKNTEIGKIATLVSETVVPETPLEKRMRRLGKMLGTIVLTLCVVVVVAGVLHERTLLETIMIAVSLAVSAVPEGLPAVVTVCFAMGVKRMARRHALVRRLDALETLGSVTVICADKTGTITENKMKVVETWCPDTADEGLLALIGASCNRAKLPDIGDPTELGLLEFAKKKKIEPLEFDEEEQPFTSEEKYMKTRHGNRSFLKGAPEKIAALCSEVETEALMEENEKMAKRGIRVLACAVQEGKQTKFIGLIGMEDPPRQTVESAIREAKQAGIRTVMITGDNIDTAQAIAKNVGIEGEAMHGEELDSLSEKELSSKVRSVAIYARVSPMHKLTILHALQKNGEVVAMSGDGVNDAPALKGAHVGVAMGKVGTQIARDAASMVLADDDYSTIVTAIREGRRIYDNIRKFVLFLLRSNFDEILFILITLLLDMPLPYLPIHILWINLMTDGLPALALGMEKAEPDVMKRPPRPQGEHILSGEWSRLILAVLWGFASSFFLFYWLLSNNTDLDTTRTTVLMMAITFELLLVFSVRSKLPIWKVGIFSNKWLVGAVCVPFLLQFVLVYTPVSKFFHLTAIGLDKWALVFAVASTGFLFFEGLKWFDWRKQKTR